MGLTVSKKTTRGHPLVLQAASDESRAQVFASYPDGFTSVKPLIGLFDFKAFDQKKARSSTGAPEGLMSIPPFDFKGPK